MFISLIAIGLALSAKAQLSPEGMMALVPELPSVNAMMKEYKSSQLYIGDSDNTMNDFVQAIRDVRDQSQSYSEAYARDMAVQMKAGAMKKKTAAEAMEMSSLGQKYLEMTQEILAMTGKVEEEWTEKYNKEYRSRVEVFLGIKRKAIQEGALEETYNPEDKPRIDAAYNKFKGAIDNINGLKCEFYEGFFKAWRDTVISQMNKCRNDLLPVCKKMGMPIQASELYINLAEKFVEFPMALEGDED